MFGRLLPDIDHALRAFDRTKFRCPNFYLQYLYTCNVCSINNNRQAIEVKDIVRELEASHPEWNVPERKVRKVLRERSLMKNDSQSLGADDASLF